MESLPIQILVEQQSPRLQYILDFIFKEVLQIPFVVYVELPADKSPIHLYYGTRQYPGVITIVPHGLLFETNLREVKEDMGEWHSLPVFLQTSTEEIPLICLLPHSI
jgi:hypothetical protein